MKLEYDEAKRDWTLRERGLDFLDAPKVLDGLHIVMSDDRLPYSEVRFQTYGYLFERLIMYA
jgi:uncharacterized protein